MARQVRDSRLKRKADRDRLRPGPKAYWAEIIPGQVALGYRRKKATLAGKWLVRRYAGPNQKGGGKYTLATIGIADDFSDANGGTILSYADALKRIEDKAAPGAPITVRQAMADYIEFLRTNGKQTKDTKQRADSLILPVLGDKLVDELESDGIRKWIADYAERPALIRPKANGKRKERPALNGDREAIRRRQSSANRLLTILKAALNLAFIEGKVQSDLAWKRVKPYKGVDVARLHHLSFEETQRLMNACDPEFRPLVRGALETGARYGELIALQVADFDLASGTVHVRHSKTYRDRRVVLSEDGVEFFRQATVGRASDELIFRGANGEPWGKAHQSRPMEDAVAAAKIKPAITFHALRHTWASMAVANGMPLTVVAKNLGHVDANMVQKHYGHLRPDYIVDAIRQYAPRFGMPEKTNVTTIPAKRRSATSARKS